MEQYLIRRKRNGQFSNRGKVVKTRKVKKVSYFKTFKWNILVLIVTILAVIISFIWL